ncbi:MAG: LCP family protein [Blautia sp.]
MDSREGQLTIDAHSDALMVASINDKTKDIKLLSVYRDTYLDNTNGEYRKATECYFFGGPTRSISMLNKNLDLDIQGLRNRRL